MDKSGRSNSRIYLAVAILLGFFAALPLFGKRFIPTHDGEYHLIRIYEFYTMLASGYFFPRWAPGLNSGFGVPIFNFHYPFPNYIGSFFHALQLPLTQAFQLSEASAYIAAIVFCFFWLKKLFPARAAFIGTVIFTFIPYWFVDIYVRGSVGEVWAIAWLMLSLLSIEYNREIIFSLSIALLILSHNILAMLFLPMLIAMLLLRRTLWWKEIVLGIGMATYFWMPAVVERGFVRGLNTVNFRDHFPYLIQLLVPSWGTGFSQEGIPNGEMSFQIGIITLIVISLGSWLSRKENAGIYKLYTAFFAALLTAAILLMLPASGWVWEWIPLLQYIQYPWRLLSYMLPIGAFFGGYCAFKLQDKPILTYLIALASVVLSIGYIRPVTYEHRSDDYYLTRREFTDGTSSISNTFTTIWADWIRERVPGKVEVTGGNATVTPQSGKPLHYKGRITAYGASTFRVHTLYYPGWTVYLNGNKVEVNHDRGVIEFSSPGGSYDLDIVFEETAFRKIADWFSIVCLFWVGVLAILRKYAYRHRHISLAK